MKIAKYFPLDEALSRPLVRALRALRHFDWCEQEDLLVACNVGSDDGERNTFWVAVGRAVKDGLVERRPVQWWTGSRRVNLFEYRITAKGRERADKESRKYTERLGRCA